MVSEIGLGGSWFYGRPEWGLQPVSYGAGIVERALEIGINYFDTAPLYGQGRSEEVLGHALKGVSKPYYLATKVGYYPEPFDYTRDTVLRGFEASLKRLQRDHVDLVQIHESEQAGWDGGGELLGDWWERRFRRRRPRHHHRGGGGEDLGI